MSIAACVVDNVVRQGIVDGSADFFEVSGIAVVEFVARKHRVPHLELGGVASAAVIALFGHA